MQKPYHLTYTTYLTAFLVILGLLSCQLFTNPPAASNGFPLAPDPPQLNSNLSETGRVVDIVDGDTIKVNIDGLDYSIRYIGINTPERGDVCFEEATEANAFYVEGQTVRLVRDVSDTDRFGRLLRYVYVEEVLVNAELVAGGWAESRRYTPDTALFDYLEGLEEEAVRQRLGCQPTGIFD